ncbi:MAG: helix-turn-helix domain-containing protein [Chloroflexia bacterium]
MWRRCRWSPTLRLRLLEQLRREPQTVKQLAAALDVAQTKLYYHIKLLEERELIRVVESRVVQGIIEKQYGVTAYRLSVERTRCCRRARPRQTRSGGVLRWCWTTPRARSSAASARG